MPRIYKGYRQAKSWDSAGEIIHAKTSAYKDLIITKKPVEKKRVVKPAPDRSNGKEVTIEVVRNEEGYAACYMIHNKADADRNPFIFQMIYAKQGGLRSYPLVAREWNVYAVIADEGWMQNKLSNNRSKPKGALEILK